MAEILAQILSLPKADRLRIAMQILVSIHDEEESLSDEHKEQLEAFQHTLSEGKVKYMSENDFWAEARKRAQ